MLAICLFELSVPSWFTLGRLYVARKLSISSGLSDLLAYNGSQYPPVIFFTFVASGAMPPLSVLSLFLWIFSLYLFWLKFCQFWLSFQRTQLSFFDFLLLFFYSLFILIAFLTSVSFISALIFNNFFFLVTLSLLFFFSFSFFQCKIGLLEVLLL